METLHNKQKGNIAEAAVELDLKLQGYTVFKELGDLSKIDLIAEKDGKLITLQVKGITPLTEGSLWLRAIKNGPGYSFKYEKSMLDYFAVVDLETLQVGYVPSDIFGDRTNIYLRVRESKNNQKTKTLSLSDFKTLSKL